MKKLNNKGLTAIEILVCFAIISVIVISMFNIINNYKEKKDLESYKLDITTYKNTVTKTIYDDIIKNNGVISATIKQEDGDTIDNPTEAYMQNTFKYEITLEYVNNKKSIIVIDNKSRCFTYKRENGKKVVDQKNQECTPEISDNIDYENSEYYISFTDSEIVTDRFDLPKIYQLKYNDIKADEINGVFHIKIGLWHSDFGTKYDVLNIITPNVITYPGML